MADFKTKFNLEDKTILLIITGGIAAYKSLDLVRRLKDCGARVRCILTEGGKKFITPLSVTSLSEEEVYTDLWSLKDETEMGHIRLSREADLVLVAPCTANFLAKIAQGRADDLASTTLLATDTPVMIAPAMNVMMWENMATQDNVKALKERGVHIVGPGTGQMACGETGDGRMADVDQITDTVGLFFHANAPLKGKTAIVTSGPTREHIDPIRYISNASSGKQGHAVAYALAQAGAKVVLVTGPVSLPDPVGVETIHVETAEQMKAACESHLPCDIAVCVAAVLNWRPGTIHTKKLKKINGEVPPIDFIENPDILATVSQAGNKRPQLVVGFSAETEDLLENSRNKMAKKECDWIVANDVSPELEIYGHDDNTVWLLKSNDDNAEPIHWPRLSKAEIARRLVDEMSEVIAVD